jgi:two-component system, NarL family, nitrate/nitrite response regulator NarL
MLQYTEHSHAVPPALLDTRAAWIVIADVQPLVLEGLAQVLRGFKPAALERCTSGVDLLAAVVSVQPDLVIMDVRLGQPDGIAALRELRERGLNIPVILMTGALRDSEVLEAVQLGIRGLLLKDAPITAVENCVRTVLSGGTCLDQDLIGRAMSALLARESALRELSQQLTAREMEVLQMVVAGTRPREAAGRLSVSEGTLKVHLHHIYQKLNVGSREHLISYARERGLV